MIRGHGGDIYHRPYRLDFSANINPLGMPASVKEAAVRGAVQSVVYPDITCGRLRRAIAEREGLEAEMVICSCGAAQLIYAIVQAVSPRRALLACPCFSEYEAALKLQGCEIVRYFAGREAEFVIGEDYPDLLTDDIDMVFLCNPGNPAGTSIPKPLLEKVLDRCTKHEILMVVDECFNGLLCVEGESRAKTMVPLVRENQRLFVLGAFTKLYAMPGLRLGYGLCSDGKLLEALNEVIPPWSVSLPAQEAGLAAVEETDFPRISRQYIRKEKEFLKEGLERCGMREVLGEANYLFFRGPANLGQLMADRGILIRDCSNYPGLEKGDFRISVRTHEENEEFLRTLSLSGRKGIGFHPLHADENL